MLFQCPRSEFGGLDGDQLKDSVLKEITDWWQGVTGFKLEFAEYLSIHNQSVNSYIAIKADGKVKRKGPIGNPWSARPDENDVRAQMMKNPQMTICSDAVLEFLLSGKPIDRRDVYRMVQRHREDCADPPAHQPPLATARCHHQ